LEQSTFGLIGTPTLTPHLPGMLAALPMFPTHPVMLLRQAHAACRSAVDDARLLSDLTPLQHDAEGEDERPMAYPRHGATADVTSPQLTAAEAVSAATSAATRTTATTAERRAINYIAAI
jgi:hypothetical protein